MDVFNQADALWDIQKKKVLEWIVNIFMGIVDVPSVVSELRNQALLARSFLNSGFQEPLPDD